MSDAPLPNDQWLRCERVCRNFEAAWRDGGCPRLEDYLPATDDPLRHSVLEELVHLDLEFRFKANQSISIEAYLERFPHLRSSKSFLIEAVEAEFLLRREAGDAPDLTEYRQRFPEFSAELERRLSTTGQMPSDARRRAASTAADRLPLIPGCELLGVLGEGGMGVVYKAFQPALNRFVAVKMIRAGARADAEDRQRFETETRAAALLRHPNVVQIHEVGDVDGQPFCVFEHVAGGSLRDLLEDGPLPGAEAAALLETIARAVHYAHQQGIIHRDLKPANVLLAPANGSPQDDRAADTARLGKQQLASKSLTLVPKIADFGLARRLAPDTALTQTGAIVGTVHYMAPEQAGGQSAGPAADVHALGAILYEMITGRPPFRGVSALDTLEMVRHDDAVPPSRLQPRLPRDLETICLKCLHKEPPRRYASAEALADDLHRFLKGEPITARPVGPGERVWRWCRRKPALATALAFAVAGLLAALAVSIAFAVSKHDDAQRLAHLNDKLDGALDEKTVELTARRKAEEARDAAEKQRRRFHRLSALLAMERGQQLCENGRAREGMLWLARALGINPAEAEDVASLLRWNIALWQPLLGEARGVFPHERAVQHAAFSPDARFLLTRDDGQFVRLWNLATGAHVSFPRADMPQIEQNIFSAAGDRFVLASEGGEWRLHDCATGAALGPSLLPKARGNRVLALHPDGRVLLCFVNGKVRLCDGVTGESVGPDGEHDLGNLLAGRFTPDGSAAVTVSWGDGRRKYDVEVRRWDPVTGKLLGPPLFLPHPVRGNSVALAADCARLLTQEAKLRCWDLGTGKQLGEIPATIPFGFLPDGKHFWAVRNDTLQTHDWTGQLVGRPLTLAGRKIHAVVWAPSGVHVLVHALRIGVEGVDHEHVLADAQQGRPVLPRLPFRDIMTQTITRDGRIRLVARDAPNAIVAIDLGPADSTRFPRPERSFDAHALSLSANLCVKRVGPLEGQLLDLKTNLPRGAPFPCSTAATAFSADERRLLCHAPDGSLRFIDTKDGVTLAHFPPDRLFRRIGLLGSDGQLVLRTGVRTVELLRDDGKTAVRAPIELDNDLNHLGPGPGARSFVTVDAGAVCIWDINTGLALHEPFTHAGKPLRRAALDPHGKRLVAVAGLGEIVRWDVASRKRLSGATVPYEIQALEFSGDGACFLTGSLVNGQGDVWDSSTGAPISPRLTDITLGHLTLHPEGNIAAVTAAGGIRLRHLRTGQMLGPPLVEPGGFVTLTWSDRHLRGQTAAGISTWRLPVPTPMPAARVGLWAQVVCAMELDDEGQTRPLSERVWQERHRSLLD